MIKAPRKYESFLGKSTSCDEFLSYLKENGKYSIPLKLDEIVEFLGVCLESDPDFANITRLGSISKDETGVRLWFNPMENQLETRKRFTIAHELAHFFLHIATSQENTISDDVISFNRDDNRGKLERDANVFAAKLLMPTDEVFAAAKELVGSHRAANNGGLIPKEDFVTEMSMKFDVSRSAMEYRLATLGIL